MSVLKSKNITVNDSVVENVNTEEMWHKCLILEAELITKHNMIEQDAYNVLMKNYDKLEQHCISLELAMQLNQENFQQNNSCENKDSLTFNQIFEVNNLKVRLKDKDKTIKKLKKEIKNLTETTPVDLVKRDIEEIETINIELEHKVTKLLKENKHLKQTYAQLHDSINPLRVQEKEQCQALVDQLNKKSMDISDLNAKLQDKVFEGPFNS
ncbi:hypothetical protein Tco_0826612 [Tanacetum coccineum]